MAVIRSDDIPNVTFVDTGAVVFLSLVSGSRIGSLWTMT